MGSLQVGSLKRQVLRDEFEAAVSSSRRRILGGEFEV
jgi:hypothetical protein